MEPNLTIDESSSTAELKLSGELSIQHAAELKDLLTRALDQSDTCRLDLNEVQAFDLSSIQLLYAFYLAAKRLNKEVSLKAGSPEIFNHAVENAGYAWQKWFEFGQG
ncbi:MAG: STAS domain-containing protein [Deltaproteobacteria bacterium]|jgi:anti-anti-sigma factor|nr:STAS domain-containing protein [Deltaproteobacteria bacterium]MBT4268650.1 STAS domain-containing protein [Deltaproteobacteria bacterium]MBT6500723.1 STAS domain-containing protein [Deltaproteobacteria bacterium]MBT6613547.1 STAS domain-containing protein [Deltaproteobacteria bacterium]MBT7151946.1 STAS domain-containing protein [Deltaproteobacteria bacterium]